jgi:dTMP kinase
MGSLAERLAGKFIVLDGPDGSGKTTQIRMLREHLAGLGAAVECVHDPGGTSVGEKIRAILLGRDSGAMDPACETMLFMASRAQLVVEKIRPALSAGKIVLGDRFISATVAYQEASGVDAQAILQVAQVAVGGVWPDLTIILDVPVEVGMHRIAVPRGRRKHPEQCPGASGLLFGERLEIRNAEYHASVRRGFLRLCQGGLYPRPVVRVEAEQDKDAVFRDVLAAMEKAFPTGDA